MPWRRDTESGSAARVLSSSRRALASRRCRPVHSTRRAGLALSRAARAGLASPGLDVSSGRGPSGATLATYAFLGPAITDVHRPPRCGGLLGRRRAGAAHVEYPPRASRSGLDLRCRPVVGRCERGVGHRKRGIGRRRRGIGRRKRGIGRREPVVGRCELLSRRRHRIGAGRRPIMDRHAAGLWNIGGGGCTLLGRWLGHLGRVLAGGGFIHWHRVRRLLVRHRVRRPLVVGLWCVSIDHRPLHNLVRHATKWP